MCGVEEVGRKKSFSMLMTNDVLGAAFCECILFTKVEGSHIKRTGMQDKDQLIPSKIPCLDFPQVRLYFYKLANASPLYTTFF